jgi:hypothetical protein
VLAAQKTDGTALGTWFANLGDQILQLSRLPPPSVAFAYLDADAFRAQHLSPPISRVRDDLKTMSVLPWLGLQKANIGEVLAVVRELTDVQTSPESGLHHLASYVRVLSDALKLAKPGAAVAMQDAVVDAVVQLASALDLAADKDWIGIAVKLTDELDSIGALKEPSVKRSISFVRILLSSYQASSPDEAKAIFSSGLETVGSRRQRFDEMAIDVGALFAARAGYDSTLAQSGTTTSSALYGLFAPVGVQFAYKHLGLLAYPIDVGSYLTVTKNESDAPQWRDSLRFGGALYFRPSSQVPVVFGGGADVRPTIGDRVGSWRVFGVLALELPLYLIY